MMDRGRKSRLLARLSLVHHPHCKWSLIKDGPAGLLNMGSDCFSSWQAGVSSLQQSNGPETPRCLLFGHLPAAKLGQRTFKGDVAERLGLVFWCNFWEKLTKVKINWLISSVPTIHHLRWSLFQQSSVPSQSAAIYCSLQSGRDVVVDLNPLH